MGSRIAIVWLVSAVILWQHLAFAPRDQTLALAFRVGLALHVVGASVGWMMTRPVAGQTAAMQRGEHPFVQGSHTVGVLDGGRGLPLVRWSTEHGDLRAAYAALFLSALLQAMAGRPLLPLASG